MLVVPDADTTPAVASANTPPTGGKACGDQAQVEAVGSVGIGSDHALPKPNLPHPRSDRCLL